MEFHCGGKVYPVFLVRKRVKYINVHIKPDGIYVSAPYHTKEAYIQGILDKDAERLAAAYEKLLQRQPDYSDGAQVSHLGEKIYLRWSEKPCQTVLQDGVLTVFARNDAEAAYAFRRWRSEECVKLCKTLNPEVCDAFRAAGYDVPLARIEIKDMSTRWGSCTPKNARISVNVNLMQYPEGCIRSVFFHEYTHFLHHGHGTEFYLLLLEMCPDYHHWDRILNGKEN